MVSKLFFLIPGVIAFMIIGWIAKGVLQADTYKSHCSEMREVGVYDGFATSKNAKEIAYPVLLERIGNLEIDYLYVDPQSDVIQLKVIPEVRPGYANSNITPINFCFAWKHDDECIGRWINLEDGLIMMEYQNPC